MAYSSQYSLSEILGIDFHIRIVSHRSAFLNAAVADQTSTYLPFHAFETTDLSFDLALTPRLRAS